MQQIGGSEDLQFHRIGSASGGEFDELAGDPHRPIVVHADLGDDESGSGRTDRAGCRL